MKSFLPAIIVLMFSACCSVARGQVKVYSPANAHAHNDYLNTRPFYDAYNNGFGSIEADVFPRDGRLLVAHNSDQVLPSNTLKKLYIDPLYNQMASGKRRNVILLIDIKEDYKKSLSLLEIELQPLMPFLSTGSAQKQVTVVISGERPQPAEFDTYPLYIYFDSDFKLKYKPGEWDRVALVSVPFNKISTWNGERDPVDNELEPVKRLVDSVHHAGKAIRFWAAPDTPLSWKWQQALQVDLIGTDKISELAAFLKKEDD